MLYNNIIDAYTVHLVKSCDVNVAILDKTLHNITSLYLNSSM